MSVSINGKGTITSAEVARAASAEGLSASQLSRLAEQLTQLSNGMNFGDGSALSQLADVIAKAANGASGGIQQPQQQPSPGSTAQPGT
jgi:hypothetical protein